MRKTYRFSTTDMINNMPLAITPHTAAPIPNDNPYLPAQYRRRSGDTETRLLYDLPKINWRAGVPVIPASSIKGSLRHLLSDEVFAGATGVDISLIDYLAIGGVRQKKAQGEAGTAQSPTEIEKLRSESPLIGVFGASDPIFVTSAFTMFGDAIPLDTFELEEIPIVRTNPIVRDLGAMRAADTTTMDAKMEAEAASSSRAKEAKNLVATTKAQLAKAEKAGSPDVAALKEKLAQARADQRANESERIVQTGQIQTRIAIPAGVRFRHHFIVVATPDELALLTGAIAAFGVQHEGMIGSTGQGCGGNLSFVYDIEEEVGGFPTVSWNQVGRIGTNVEDNGSRSLVATGVAEGYLSEASRIMEKMRSQIAEAA